MVRTSTRACDRTTKKATIVWDLPVHTVHEIKANRPDTILKCKDEKSCLLIDIAIPTDKNISITVTVKKTYQSTKTLKSKLRGCGE